MFPVWSNLTSEESLRTLMKSVLVSDVSSLMEMICLCFSSCSEPVGSANASGGASGSDLLSGWCDEWTAGQAAGGRGGQLPFTGRVSLGHGAGGWKHLCWVLLRADLQLEQKLWCQVTADVFSFGLHLSARQQICCCQARSATPAATWCSHRCCRCSLTASSTTSSVGRRKNSTATVKVRTCWKPEGIKDGGAPRLRLPSVPPVSISFENFRMVHPYEDSESSEDEVDWQDTRHDPYRAGEAAAASGRSFWPDPHTPN